jgi:hypothetical protein
MELLIKLYNIVKYRNLASALKNIAINSIKLKNEEHLDKNLDERMNLVTRQNALIE